MHCSFECAQALCQIISEKIKQKGDKFDAVIGITAGGLIPSIFLRNALGVQYLFAFGTSGYDSHTQKHEQTIFQQPDAEALRGKHVLLCDDISDSGRTFETVSSWLKLHGIRFKTAALHAKPTTKYIPDYVAETTTEWVVYEWDPPDKR
ncbi:MAG: phosphoribosyltransferase domain-containing protein [Candidatus Blackburnbacteria bacterium]|nr:phosphoribosyltransferase domain-containing protein [Candidatus Blackburnbacteria bacterium]